MCPVRELGELPLILRRPLIWRKDNTSRLLARFVADVRLLPEVRALQTRKPGRRSA
jgi:hypothetical protein